LFAGVISLLGLTSIHCIHSCILINEKTITLYAFKGINALEFRSGNTVQLIQSYGQFSQQDSVYLRQHWRLNNMAPVKLPAMIPNLASFINPPFFPGCSLFQFYEYKLALISDPFQLPIGDHKIEVDALVISGNPSVQIDVLMQFFQTRIIILDPSNSSYHIHKWQDEARQSHIVTYDVGAEGAFIKRL
ncbi:MAG: hypothetical protein ABIO46_13050, partial [Chitinophagales bacterium]